MLFLIALIIAVFIAFVLDKPLKKHPTVFYVTAAVLTAVSIIINNIKILVTYEKDSISICSTGRTDRLQQ
jgi:predicted tellurium resistance membrane protein TerC